jgi:hypothetical protein
MNDKDRNVLVRAGFLLGLIVVTFASGCVVEPNEGYYDRDHHRYYHEHGWVACGDDEHCRDHDHH